MKKAIFLFAVALCSLTAGAQFYQYKNYPANPGYSFGSQPDVTIDNYPAVPQLVSVVDENTFANDDGVVVLRSDLSSGMPLSSTQFSVAGTPIIPVRVLTFQAYTYVAGYTPTANGERFVFMRINSTTNVVSYCRYFDAPGTYNVRPADLCYAGGGIFYMTGTYDYGGGSAIFMAKLTFTGALTDYRTIHINSHNATTCAMQWYASNCIYLSGVATSTTNANNMYGFIVTYDPTTLTATAMTYQFYTFNSLERLTIFKAVRNAKRIYVAGETFLPSIGNKPNYLLVGQLDAGTQLPLAWTVYNAGVFRWTSRLNLANGFITLTGYVDAMDAMQPGFVNVYFNLATAWTAGNLYTPTMSTYAGIESVLDASGTVYSIGNRVIWGDTLYRIKGRPLNGQTTCDVPFGFFSAGNPLTATSLSTNIVGYTYNFYDTPPVTVTPFPLGNDILCYDNSVRLAAPEEENAPLSVYPNPATDQLTISLHIADEELLHAEVLDLSARKLMAETLEAGEQHTLSIGDLPAGVYLLRISGENRTPQTVRFVKE